MYITLPTDKLLSYVKLSKSEIENILILSRMGIFGATHGWGGEQKDPPP